MPAMQREDADSSVWFERVCGLLPSCLGSSSSASSAALSSPDPSSAPPQHHARVRDRPVSEILPFQKEEMGRRSEKEVRDGERERVCVDALDAGSGGGRKRVW
eukprot:1236213-Rhodomonas_salina.1